MRSTPGALRAGYWSMTFDSLFGLASQASMASAAASSSTEATVAARPTGPVRQCGRDGVFGRCIALSSSGRQLAVLGERSMAFGCRSTRPFGWRWRAAFLVCRVSSVRTPWAPRCSGRLSRVVSDATSAHGVEMIDLEPRRRPHGRRFVLRRTCGPRFCPRWVPSRLCRAPKAPLKATVASSVPMGGVRELPGYGYFR